MYNNNLEMYKSVQNNDLQMDYLTPNPLFYENLHKEEEKILEALFSLNFLGNSQKKLLSNCPPFLMAIHYFQKKN